MTTIQTTYFQNTKSSTLPLHLQGHWNGLGSSTITWKQ